jgi:hypothetical protein
MPTVEITTPNAKHVVLEEKLTSIGLYVTSKEAYEMWLADRSRRNGSQCSAGLPYIQMGRREG